MAFNTGDSVEVSMKEEGFFGSYYPATILQQFENKKYLVQYHTLLEEEDQNHMLQEVVSAAEIRPSPPKHIVMHYRTGDLVDVYDNDGWWVGKLTSRRKFNDYGVYFESSGDVIGYPVTKLRVHQEWKNGRWYLSRKKLNNY
ncbi:hypothetical protein ACHQM5_000269 [Ranunculus cassubicifolius]